MLITQDSMINTQWLWSILSHIGVTCLSFYLPVLVVFRFCLLVSVLSAGFDEDYVLLYLLPLCFSALHLSAILYMMLGPFYLIVAIVSVM